jgi:hypothetical protein
MHVSTKDGLRDKGFPEKIIDELVTATLTANYGQSASVHEFVGETNLVKSTRLKGVFLFLFPIYQDIQEIARLLLDTLLNQLV